MSRPREPLRRRTRETPAFGRRLDGGRGRQCTARRGRLPGQVSVQLVADLAGLRARLSPPYSPEQAAVIADAAVTDTLKAVGAQGATATSRLEQAFAGLRHRAGPVLLIGTEIPQLRPDLLADAAALLDEFDAVLGPTDGDGWWAFGLREPAHSAMSGMTPQALAGTGALTVAALRLGLRVAMLPTLLQVRTGADVHAVAGHCPPGSSFAAAVARLRPAGWPGR
jgi:glycosyltransferase A (GT-A) superfamily protein (DUF2064 family)